VVGDGESGGRAPFVVACPVFLVWDDDCESMVCFFVGSGDQSHTMHLAYSTRVIIRALPLRRPLRL
jgi:hypothetical protein